MVNMTATVQPIAAARAGAQVQARTRLLAIDALRGLVMVFMLVDHVREIVYAHHAVSDPMNALTIEPALFFTRMTSQICAPIFVALTGLSAFLYGQSHSTRETSVFLLKRGLFLIALEFTLVTGAWAAQHFPPTFWLQVIWAIGLCMIALAALIHLPRAWQLGVGAVIVCGHNLLDGIVLTPDSPFYIPWAVLHQRALFDLGGGVMLKISYPVLPWIGVILLGYAIGPWFARGTDPTVRIKRLLMLGSAMIVAFVLIRFANVYGDKPWVHTGDSLRTVMSFLTATKYPPSLMFLLPTLGLGAILLALFEQAQEGRAVPMLAFLGGAPMFFYILHLYVLKALYFIAVAVFGHNQGATFGVDNVASIWLIAAVLLGPLYLPSRWFAGFKQRRRDIWWLRYL
ncbi:MAG TPA: heparan-alpha-glucosaminide N-acetyltransferase domain-containing protein [Phenylobacterium sp.]|nr:heparan-alpha-glucosaminide N-acetyltransferase domain-containing protein [Phenylobacterium sp.]